MSTEAHFDGGCACGTVRYRVCDAPLFVNCCHCHDCQRQTGSASVLNALIEAERVVLVAGSDAIKPTTMPTDSGRPHVIHRCTHCGTALWSNYGGNVLVRFVRVGTLDAPAALPPDAHIYTRTRLPWIHLPDDVPGFSAYYDLRTLWPEPSLARWRALSR